MSGKISSITIGIIELDERHTATYLGEMFSTTCNETYNYVLYIKFIYKIAIRFQLWLSIMLSIFAKRCIWERKTIKLFRPHVLCRIMFLTRV